MGAKIVPDFTPVLTKRIQVGREYIEIPDPSDLQRQIRNLKTAVNALSGQAPGGAQLVGPVNLNGNKITGLTNSTDTPASDEAVSYSLAQQEYTTYRNSLITVGKNYFIQPADGTILSDASQKPLNHTLPPATSATNKVLVIKKIDHTVNPVSISPVPGEKIDGQPSFSFANFGDSITVQSDGRTWWIL